MSCSKVFGRSEPHSLVHRELCHSSRIQCVLEKGYTSIKFTFKFKSKLKNKSDEYFHSPALMHLREITNSTLDCFLHGHSVHNHNPPPSGLNSFICLMQVCTHTSLLVTLSKVVFLFSTIIWADCTQYTCTHSDIHIYTHEFI